VTSLRLVADVAVRVDGSLWTDVWLRNDVAMREGGGAASYAARITLDGREVLRTETVRHWQYAGWGRLVGAGQGGAAPPKPPTVRADAAYLAETAAIACYDLTAGVADTVFAQMAQAMQDPSWDLPLGGRAVMLAMGTGGGRPDLGLTTLWQAAWLVTGDPRAAAFSIGQAEAAGSVPWHFWDPAGGAEGRGGWMDERRWSRFWFDARGGRPPRTLLQPVPPSSEQGGWQPDAAHQPNLTYVPYLLTGRRAFLDELLAQAAWNVLDVWPAVRAYESDGPARGVVVVNRQQVRASAWAMRQLDQAAWISPDDDPARPYLREVAAANWTWLRAQIPAWTALQGEVHGYIPWPEFGYGPSLSPWQQDYFASTAALAARRGSEDARAVLAWMSNFLVGRFFAHEKGFSRHDAVNYTIAIRSASNPQSNPPAPHLTTWAQIGAATRERGRSNGNGWQHSNGEYARLGLLSLAMIKDVLGSEEARQAYAWLASSGAPFIGVDAYRRAPEHNVVPLGMPRVRTQPQHCTPSAKRTPG
jgi:hypothetical protein